MSHYELLRIIRIGLNDIMNSEDKNTIILLYKLSLLVRNTNDDRFIKLFMMNYMNFYYAHIEFIKGIEHMSDENINIIKDIITNSFDLFVKDRKSDDENYRNLYHRRRESFLNVDINTIRSVIKEELLSGIHHELDNIEKIKEYVDSISYEEQAQLEKINIDDELERLKEKRQCKYTEEGNFAEDEEELNIVIRNINKKGYRSNHLHIHVYDTFDNTIYHILNNQKFVYEKT